MYKIFATLFLITNGIPATEPSEKIANKHIFQTQEECDNYFNTDVGQQAKAYLELIAKDRYKLEFNCVHIESSKYKGEEL